MLDELYQRMRERSHAAAMIWRDLEVTYGALVASAQVWTVWLDAHGVEPGTVVHLDADVSPRAIALLLALLRRRAIVALTSNMPAAKRDELRELCQAELRITLDAGGELEVQSYGDGKTHELLLDLRREDRPGLVIFSSGSTGKSKAAVHDALPLLEKFRSAGRQARVLAFLLFDHIGGLNTLFYTLFNGGTVIVAEARTPDKVGHAIARHRADALTTTPTFLRLLLVSRAHERHDLSSLRIINYGTEVMPASTLGELRRILPGVRLSQAYGLSEVGVLPVRSRSSDCLFIKIGEAGTEIRVRGGQLEIRSRSAMRGYLNAPSPFTEDGWFKTGDAVEVEGDYLRVLGRASEMINVGGQKVYPAEVESVLETIPGVEAAMVVGEPHPFTGQIVKASVRLTAEESLAAFSGRMRAHCRTLLPAFMIPQKVVFADTPGHSVRFKKLRSERQAR